MTLTIEASRIRRCLEILVIATKIELQPGLAEAGIANIIMLTYPKPSPEIDEAVQFQPKPITQRHGFLRSRLCEERGQGVAVAAS